ncbi:MAG: hypothetical protein JXQ73_28220 [Phycisphaerae bacterium]|nr:hypothetical protein [Phycisphaerae bacterium]
MIAETTGRRGWLGGWADAFDLATLAAGRSAGRSVTFLIGPDGDLLAETVGGGELPVRIRLALMVGLLSAFLGAGGSRRSAIERSGVGGDEDRRAGSGDDALTGLGEILGVGRAEADRASGVGPDAFERTLRTSGPGGATLAIVPLAGGESDTRIRQGEDVRRDPPLDLGAGAALALGGDDTRMLEGTDALAALLDEREGEYRGLTLDVRAVGAERLGVGAGDDLDGDRKRVDPDRDIDPERLEPETR